MGCAGEMKARGPHLVVFSSLYPSPRQPLAGIFIRERMQRVAAHLPIAVVSPQPWFPFQAILRRWRPHYRPKAPPFEVQLGIEVYRPRFFSVPGVLKQFDGFFIALGALATLLKLKWSGRLDLIDAHFAYPDGYGATLLGRWLGVPVTVTLRGTEVRQAADPILKPRVQATLRRASRVFAVSDALRKIAVGLGTPSEKTRVVGNGVDIAKFHPLPRDEARRALNIPMSAKVLVGVGGLVERKGFHRVIDCLPMLARAEPSILYLIVGGAGPEGDWSSHLKRQVADLGMQNRVRFLGALPPDSVKVPLSAADVFVLATRNEGWANVFLEAMACGLPVVTTNVGGNAEVVCDDALGLLIPFDDHPALLEALRHALVRPWNRDAIMAYARHNSWDDRVAALVEEFTTILSATAQTPFTADRKA